MLKARDLKRSNRKSVNKIKNTRSLNDITFFCSTVKPLLERTFDSEWNDWQFATHDVRDFVRGG